MNQIDTLISHLNYDADRRVVLINADDFRRPGDLAFLNISNDIVVIVGELRRLHRWKGLQYPQAEIFRFFVGGGELSTHMALAAQGVALAQELPKLKTLPWLVLSDDSEAVLAVLRINGVRRCKACTLQQPEKHIEVYHDVAAKADKTGISPTGNQTVSRSDIQPYQRTPGGRNEVTPKNSKHHYPVDLTEVGQALRRIVEAEGGGFPISLVKFSRLIDQHAEQLPSDVMQAVTAQRAKYRTVSRAIQLLAKQNGFQIDGQQVMGVSGA
ncbi:hypothetical protein [Halomonas sp. KO116]|uniref:hypothetical protein n=1 Tax=Halomonas sp. KO116 TaxID=1504981 RepID=UPI0004E3F784|nr:hypothetical protein [Halomonas sp. KO116]AJY53227.1 hypothetical protein KO116_P200120 [Halomonas sp. KO116]